MNRRFQRLLIILLLVFPVVFISLTYLEDIAETGGQDGAGAFATLIANLPRTVIETASSAGYVGIFGLMLLEAAAFPIPSEIVLPLAGYLVSQGVLEFWLVVFYSTVAALIGSFIDYFLGWKVGRSLLTGRSRLPYVSATHFRRAQTWFENYGPFAVALFRLVPGARVLISFPAGAYGMSKWRFAAYTFVGCLPWNITLVYLGLWLGSSWPSVVAVFRYINLVVYGLIILFLIWIGWKFKLRKDRRG